MGLIGRRLLLVAGLAAVSVTGLMCQGCSSSKPNTSEEARPKPPEGDKPDPANGAPPPIDNTKK
jgi:hypothetical protein